MTRKVLYGKIGRSMPLTLAKCGTLGGDIEMTATLTALANAYPDDEFILIGRNTGENPQDVGLPKNVTNPWTEWGPELRAWINGNRLNHPNLTVDEHLWVLGKIMHLSRVTFLSADAMVMWVGQHGTSNSPIPKVDDRSQLTKPQDAFTYYSGFLLRGINEWRDVNPIQREPIFLNADPRNYLKMRDMKWPLQHPVLTQFDFTHRIKHERYGDKTFFPYFYANHHVTLPAGEDEDTTWHTRVRNVYSRLELNALLPGTPSGDLLTFDDRWEHRDSFGVVINEARVVGVHPSKTRLTAMRDWIMPLRPSFVFGTWSKPSEQQLMNENPWYIPQGSLPWEKYAEVMHRVRCTFTTPSSGSGWATTKPWEAFGLGVVCFFHPAYDTQNNILIDAPEKLRWWLRVNSPRELRDRVIYLSTPAGREDWLELVHLQRSHFNDNIGNTGRTPDFMQMIDDRLNGAK